MNKKNKNELLTEGFSLLEIVLSIAIGTIVIGSLSSYLFSIKLSLEKEMNKANKFISLRSKGFILIPVLVITSLISMLISVSFTTEQNVIRIDRKESCMANYVLALDAYSKQISYLISVYSRNKIIDEKYLRRLENEESLESNEINSIYGTKISINNIDVDDDDLYPVKIDLEIKASNCESVRNYKLII